MIKSRLFSIGISLLLSACAATQIHSYDNALIQFYSTKITAEDTQDWNRYETATTSLENLAREADEKADEEKEDANKISLYRIAATAAWQADRNNEVLRIAGKGAELCAEDGNAELAPRDCAMLDVIPILAAIDENTRTYESLNEKVISTAGNQREATHGEASVALFGSAENGMIVLLDKRDNTSPKVSDGYKQVLDQNIETAAGVFNQTYTVLRMAHNVDSQDNGADPTETSANCRVLAIKNTLASKGLVAAANKLIPENENATCP